MKEAQSRNLAWDSTLADVFLQVSTSALQKLLQLPGLITPVIAAWKKASVDQLVSFALLDRYLRRNASETWRQCLDQVAQYTEDKIKNNEAPDERLILRLEGKEQKRLQATYPDAWKAWSESWNDSTQRAISHLASRPRGVSLANAEKLLSQQVYTDQGHFILELLQNADDAGASEFEVRFDKDSITVIHDGVPFDFRDLVGVLSIGQTTKTERQIGYFGVGFKSVFEVTERPRIYSGHFAFEIIDISIPRFLATESDAQGKTTLVLPLKEGLDIEPYFKRALEIEQTLLLNLPNVKTLRWRGPNGTETVLSQSQDGAFHSLSKGTDTETYLVWRGEYHHQGERPEGKPKSANVMLAFPQDTQNLVWLEQNLYSFLPIQENSGLRFLIGSHFDVPVDRERLDQTSPWNRGIIASIPKLIKENCEANPSAVLELLKSLPLAEDSVGPLFEGLSSELAEALRSLRFIETPEGPKHAAMVQVPEPELARFFEEGERPDFLHPTGERQQKWLEALGARIYDLKALLFDLARHKPPKRLATKNLEAWTSFHKLLLQSSSFEAWEEKLRAVPLFIDNAGELASARALCQLPEEWQDIFREPPRTVWSELLAYPETETLMASLRVRTLEWKDLLRVLHDRGLQDLNIEALMEQLLEAPKMMQNAFFRLPLFTDLEGNKTALAAPGTFGPGALVPLEDTPVLLFESLIFCTQSKLIEPLLEAYGWPRFDRSAALKFLFQRKWKPGSQDAKEFRGWLLAEQSDWATLEDLERLSGLPIFESSDGPLRVLKELWNYQEEELSDLLPELPQLLPGSDSDELVHHFGLQYRLGQANLTTLIEEFEKSDSKAVLALLSSRAQSLSREQISQLLRKPLVNGCAVKHDDVVSIKETVEVADPAFCEFLLQLGIKVVDLEYTQLLAPLMEAAGYKMLGLKTLVETLQIRAPKPESLPDLYELLLAHSIELHLGYSQTVLRKLLIWECVDGFVRSANEIPPNQELAELFEIQKHQPKTSPPEELFGAFELPDQLEFVVEFVRNKVRPNEPLFEQPSWFNTVAKVDAVSSYLTKHVLCVDIREQVRDTRLYYAPESAHVWLREKALLHPESSQIQVKASVPMPASDILFDFKERYQETPCRLAFYEYLEVNLGQVVRDSEAREFLLKESIWRSTGDNWRRLEELILESGIPDLGFDLYPHSEIPESLVEQLKNTLDVGRPEPKTMLATLLPVYKEKVFSGEDSHELLQALAKVSDSLSAQEVTSVVRDVYQFEDFLLSGRVPLSASYAPPTELDALKAIKPQLEEVRFLRKLGLPYLPSVDKLEARGQLEIEDAVRLQELVSWVWEERSHELEHHMYFLSRWPWIVSRAKDLRAPVQLYVPSAEVEELLGDAPHLYPQHQLPLSLFRALGFRDESDVELPHALQFLKSRIQEKARIGASFYYFLDESLSSGRLSAEFLASSFQDLAWIWTDEGEYRNHQEVLGFPAYRYFGPFRGTWERSNSRFPTLTSFFNIPEHLSANAILEFFQQVSQGRYPECPPRILLNGLAFLSQANGQPDRTWKVILAREFPSHEEALVSAGQRGVYRSNSPTLASLFGQGGKLWVVETDDPEHGEALSRLYDRLAIPKLRESYTVKPHNSGSDVTEQMTDLVVQFRTLLRALDRVLPRLKVARPEWADGEWLSDSQLRPFTTTASIRVIDGLQLLYELPDVSSVLVRAAVAYDPDERRLLVSTEAAREPQRYAVDLAEGLSDCIYQGQGSENLVDLLNLLLLFGTEEQMHAYLDQRHFPRPFDQRESGDEPWRKRLGEILDYGLHQVLKRRFPELEEARWEKWRDPEWQPENTSAKELLSQIGVWVPSPELLEALDEMMEAPEVILPSSEEIRIVKAASISSEHATETSPNTEQESASPTFGGFRKKLAEKLSHFMKRSPSQLNNALGADPDVTDLSHVYDSYQHPPERHLLFSDRDLKGHNLYCLAFLCSNFDSKTQLYTAGWSDWSTFFIPSGKTVQFSGSPTDNVHPLPTPLYSRLCGTPDFEVGENSVEGPDQMGLYRLGTAEQVSLSYTVELSLEPDYKSFDYLRDFDPRLISTTVMLDQLPADIRKWIDWAKSSGLPHWQLADRAKEFVRASYKYDINYRKSEAVVALNQEPIRRGENRFLRILHAGAGGGYLGRGICTELSAILLEMLRHSGIPCVIASVWMLEQSLIHIPDHSVVMALLPSDHGPYLRPLETSVQRVPPTGQRDPTSFTRLELLELAAKLLLPDLAGVPTSADRRQRFLQDRLLGVVGDSDLLELYLECLARPGQLVKDLSPELRELYDRGFLDIGLEELYEVRVRTL